MSEWRPFGRGFRRVTQLSTERAFLCPAADKPARTAYGLVRLVGLGDRDGDGQIRTALGPVRLTSKRRSRWVAGLSSTGRAFL